MSDTIPPPIDKQAEPPSPENMRKIRRDVIFGDKAQASSQMAKRAVLISKIYIDTQWLALWRWGRRLGTYYLATELLTQRSGDERANLSHILEDIPSMFLKECLLTTYPRMKNDTVNVDKVVESLSNSAFINVVAGAKIDEANGLCNLRTAKDTMSIPRSSPDKAEPADQ
jgi:hypothetical protein